MKRGTYFMKKRDVISKWGFYTVAPWVVEYAFGLGLLIHLEPGGKSRDAGGAAFLPS